MFLNTVLGWFGVAHALWRCESSRLVRVLGLGERVLVRPTRLGGGELGDGLGALGDGVLGELTGEDEPDSGLDLPGGDRGLLVVPGELGGLGRDLLEDVVDERVHDAHGLGADAGIGVNLLQNLVDVDCIRFLAALVALLTRLASTCSF